MRLGNVKVGMKVVPHSKSTGCMLYNSNSWEHAQNMKQPYLYVNDICLDMGCLDLSHITLGVSYDKCTGDLFLARDFTPYEESLRCTGNGADLDTDKISLYWKKYIAKCTYSPRDYHYNIPQIEQIIFNPPATIVKWQDGTKTIVKVSEGQTFDKETGVAACFMKKIFGNHSKFKREIENKTTQIKK